MDNFKKGILILGVVFLILFYQYGQNNRYLLIHEGESMTVFDTRTGVAYIAWQEWVFGKIRDKNGLDSETGMLELNIKKGVISNFSNWIIK